MRRQAASPFLASRNAEARPFVRRRAVIDHIIEGQTQLKQWECIGEPGQSRVQGFVRRRHQIDNFP
eukprot:4346781-Pyramimonas_sp.AAC.1